MKRAITGALDPRAEGRRARRSAWSPAAANIAWTTAPPNGFSDFQTAVQKDNYKVEPVNLLQKAEVPSDCTVLVIAGPTGDYIQPEVDAIKKYVEDGGRALFLLDPPLQLGRNEISDNAALVDFAHQLGRDSREGSAAG